MSIDARSAKKGVPAIGDVASAAKNLDEYQFLICSMVPSLPDSNPVKDGTAEISCGHHTAFAKLLLLLLKSIQQDDLVQWSKHAKNFLEETSDTYLKANSNSKLNRFA